MVQFSLDPRSGVAPYLQLVQQVRQAVRLGQVTVGDQLPTVKDVVGRLAINPNTVLKAYRVLEREGLTQGRPGVGTFITRSAEGPVEVHTALLGDVLGWIAAARRAGLDDDGISALFTSALRSAGAEDLNAGEGVA